MSDLKRAESWHTIEVQCPHCANVQEVEPFEDSEDLEVDECEFCRSDFAFSHPASDYH